MIDKEQIMEAGEELVKAYQARVDGKITSEQLKLAIDKFPDQIFALLPEVDEEGLVKDMLNIVYDADCTAEVTFITSTGEQALLGWAKSLIRCSLKAQLLACKIQGQKAKVSYKCRIAQEKAQNIADDIRHHQEKAEIFEEIRLQFTAIRENWRGRKAVGIYASKASWDKFESEALKKKVLSEENSD